MDSLISSSAKLYKCSVNDSSIGDYSSVGDYSKVMNSTFSDYVRVDRYNHVDSSIIGKYSYTGKNTTILHAQIGSFTSISWNVTLGGANHDYNRGTQHPILYDSNLGFVDEPIYDRYKEPLIIGSDVWIGANAVILRGVKIGHGAVIGANSVISRDVPPYAICVGSQGRIVKYRFPKATVDEMLAIRWWEWSNEKIKDNIHFLSNNFNKGVL